MSNKTLLCLIMIICGTGLAPSALAGKIYKWTDEKGQVHFGSQPPPQTKVELVKKTLDTPTDSESSVQTQVASSTANSTPANAAGSGAPSLKDKGRCEHARSNLESLKTFSRIRMKQDNGEYRELTSDEKQQQIKESELAIKQACE